MLRHTAKLLGLVLLLGSLLFAAAPGGQQDSPSLRVGVFDSRAVAIAWVRSKAFEESFQEQRTEFEANLKRARQAGDDEWIQELEEQMRSTQETLHKQGFSTFPIDNILLHLKDHLEAIARDAQVDLLVSKWDLTYCRESVKRVDLTAAMVEPFHPDPATRKAIGEIQAQTPVPLEELKGFGQY